MFWLIAVTSPSCRPEDGVFEESIDGAQQRELLARG